MINLYRNQDAHVIFIFNKIMAPNIIDLGYHKGSFELSIKKYFTNYKYIGIEANPNLITKKFYKKKKIFNYLVTNKNFNSLKIFANNELSSNFFDYSDPIMGCSKKKVHHDFKKKEENNVKFKTIKEIYKISKFKFVDILKIDVEGSEYDFLTKRNINFLSKNTKQICIEFHDHMMDYLHDINKKKILITLNKKILKIFKKNNFLIYKFSKNYSSITLINKNFIKINFFEKIYVFFFKYYQFILRRISTE